jgi:hypothetical protein
VKRYFFLLLFYSVFIYARPPIIDYKLITEWCTAHLPSDHDELHLITNYLAIGKQWAHLCSNDLSFGNSPQGKELLEAMQRSIAECLESEGSKSSYENLAQLIKKELALNTNHCGQKRTYKVLAIVYEGCLRCALAKGRKH